MGFKGCSTLTINCKGFLIIHCGIMWYVLNTYADLNQNLKVPHVKRCFCVQNSSRDWVFYVTEAKPSKQLVWAAQTPFHQRWKPYGGSVWVAEHKPMSWENIVPF